MLDIIFGFLWFIHQRMTEVRVDFVEFNKCLNCCFTVWRKQIEHIADICIHLLLTHIFFVTAPLVLFQFLGYACYQGVLMYVADESKKISLIYYALASVPVCQKSSTAEVFSARNEESWEESWGRKTRLVVICDMGICKVSQIASCRHFSHKDRNDPTLLFGLCLCSVLLIAGGQLTP